MSTENTATQETAATTRRTAHRNDLAHAATEKTRKRARWEALRLAPCPGARRINVANESHADPKAHTHTVTVGTDGVPTDCTCPAATYQPGPCKHAVACAGDHDALTSAMTTDDNHETDADADNHETETATDAPTATAPVTMADKLRADGRLVATDGGKDEDAFACPWTNCHETFPRTGGDHPDALLLSSHAYAVHNGHISDPESCVIEGSR